MNFQPTSMGETEATSLLSSQNDQGVQPLQFIKDESYTTFRAEHAFEDEDIVFHFFKTAECPAKGYWDDVFPNTMSDVAQAVFQAGFPRLKAAWTQEVESWWLRCNGFANEGLPEERIKRFYSELDQALEAKNSKAPRG
jgi:hypothetical protein